MNNENLYNEIKIALKNRELTAYYQPQYNTVTGRMVSAEALVRWIRPDGSMRSPAEFIPFAEENGIVTEIDWYILHEACRTLRKQMDMGSKPRLIAVNFSRLHLDERDFTEKLCGILDSYGITHDLIGVELTESAMTEHNEDTILFVKRLREEGFSVAIDDFGSGMSSLMLVHDIDADVLKIDRSLLRHNCQVEKERILLESTIEFARRLKMHIVAEGVETQEQLGFLRTCGCSSVQGFLFAKPMPESEYLSLSSEPVQSDDILMSQSTASALALLTDAIFTRFPLIITINLTRNSYYMMAYENFTQCTCAASGAFDELIAHGASTMHPEDMELFRTTFSRENLMRAHDSGEQCVKVVTRQICEDGIYRRVETADYFVKSPFSDDVLVFAFCQNLE